MPAVTIILKPSALNKAPMRLHVSTDARISYRGRQFHYAWNDRGSDFEFSYRASDGECVTIARSRDERRVHMPDFEFIGGSMTDLRGQAS